MNNLLQKYLNYINEICDAPDVFSQAVLYTITGTVIERKRYICFGDINIYPNLWIVLLAPSSTFRKSTSINLGVKILTNISPLSIYPSEFSHERLVDLLEVQPSGLFVFYEFLSLMGLLEREYMAGSKALLTELFDCPAIYQRKTKSKEILIENPAISLISATTIEWIKSKMKESDLLGGFFPRILFVPAMTKTRTIYFPQKADTNKKNEIIKALYDIKESLNPAREYILSEPAKKLFIEFSKKLENQLLMNQMRENVLFARSSIYLLKICIIAQTLIDVLSPEISEEAMREAIYFINYCIHSIRENMIDELSFTKDEDKIKKVLKIIRQHKDGITKSKLLVNTRFLSSQLNQILQTLLEGEFITVEKQKAEGTEKYVHIYKIKKEEL
jgi:hypothetical protein